MARYSEHVASNILHAAEVIRADCLHHDGSHLLDDAADWSPVVLVRIPKTFVASPDDDSRSFITKLSRWISRTSRKAHASCAPRPV